MKAFDNFPPRGYFEGWTFFDSTIYLAKTKAVTIQNLIVSFAGLCFIAAPFKKIQNEDCLHA